VPLAFLRLQVGRGLDLGTQIGRCVHQLPIAVVGAKRQLRLFAYTGRTLGAA
jgi:hypothetical protein